MPKLNPVMPAVMMLLLATRLTLQAQDVGPGKNGDAASGKTADDFYRGDEVQSVHLTIAKEDLKRMREALPKRITVNGSFRWRDLTLDNVAVHFKGNSSSGPTQKHKRSFLVKFNEYDSNQRFLGLRRASFDNGVQFGSLFSEPIITEILRDLGIPTHRCNYAKLYLNGEYQGVYGNVERIDESFLANHLPDPKGLLFRVDEGGPGCNLQFLGDDPSAYAQAFEPETKASRKSQKDLVDFIKWINQSKGSDFAANFDARMESDDFLRVTAVLLLAGAFDQLTGWNPHNYYLYLDGKRNRWRYLPWDLDVGFCEVAFGKLRILDEWHAAWPVPGTLQNPLLEKIVSDPRLLERYRVEARKILDKYFEPELLCSKIEAKFSLIREDLKTDPFPHRRVTNPEDRNYDDIVGSMKTFVRKRHALARKQLVNPGPRPEVVRRPPGPPHQIIQKVQRLQKAVEAQARGGKDVSPIQKMMQKFGPLMQQEKFMEAEKLVNEALQLAGEKQD